MAKRMLKQKKYVKFLLGGPWELQKCALSDGNTLSFRVMVHGKVWAGRYVNWKWEHA